ncbi:MAG: hypothetical protein ACOY4R_30645 [Pseudomonadota bacterium]
MSAFSCSSADAQQCVAQFQNTQQQAYANLGTCAKRHRLMESLPGVDLLKQAIEEKSAHEWTVTYWREKGGADPKFTWQSRPDYKVKLPDAADGRWKSDGSSISFNCSLPLSVQAQDESFLECVRVYSCALQATSCAVNEAHRTQTNDCNGVANRCLERHRIPGMASLDGGTMTAAPVLPPTARPGTSAPRPQPQAAPQPPTGPGQQVFQQMSPQCRAQLNRLLEGADSNDKAKAAAAYGALRADCDPQIRRAAEVAQVGLPERVLSPRASRAMENAMSGNPGRLAEAYADRGYDAGFDVDAVINFGFAMLGILSGVAGVYAAMPSGGYYASGGGGGNFTTLNPRARSTYGQGAPTGPAAPTNRSTITGTIGR